MSNNTNTPNNITSVMFLFEGLTHEQARACHEYEMLTSDEQMFVDMLFEDNYNL